MCPETSKNNDIRIYKCVEFPLSWKLHKILIKNIDACDTNIFFHQKKWWIMTNVDSSNIGDHNSELHIYYSDSLDSQEWIPHPANPIIFDSNKARNGGLLKRMVTFIVFFKCKIGIFMANLLVLQKLKL